MATNNPKNLSLAAETLKNSRKSSKIKNLLLKYVPSKPKLLDRAREVASSIWNFCKHVPINVAKKVVNSALSLFASKDKALPQPEYEEEQHELEYEEPPFVLIKSDSALKDFVKQYTIDGRPRYDPESFLKVVKEVVNNIATEKPKSR